MADYQALYRKYRPKTFDEVVGQRAITDTLKKQTQTGKLSHAYLFTGSRGTGKTTCAKILSKAVNCENPQDGNPCNQCAACRGIDAGSVLDVLEIDAASNSGVDHVRALRDDAVYTPSEVKKRVYIIDEAHMLSGSAFNALLKIIEEPPPHLMFILATTELHKVPATILSRCQRFSFRRILPEDITRRLQYVAYQEGIDLTDEGARLLARLADGGLRDALSLLDQCASAITGIVDPDAIYGVLGLAGDKNAAAFMQAIANKDAKAALTLFQRLYDAGKDVAAVLDELCSLSRDLLLLKTAPGAAMSMLSGVCSDDEAQNLAGMLSAGELLRITKLIQETASGFAKSANRRIDAELCLMQLCTPELNLDLEALNARLSRLEEKLAAGLYSVPAAPQPKAASEDAGSPPWEDAGAPPPSCGAEPDAPERRAPQPDRPARAAEDETPPGFWPDLVSALRAELKPPVSGMFVSSGGPVEGLVQGDTLLLVARENFSLRIIDKPEVLELAAAKASALLGRPVRAKAVLPGQTGGRQETDPFQELLEFGRQHDNIKIQ